MFCNQIVLNLNFYDIILIFCLFVFSCLSRYRNNLFTYWNKNSGRNQFFVNIYLWNCSEKEERGEGSKHSKPLRQFLQQLLLKLIFINIKKNNINTYLSHRSPLQILGKSNAPLMEMLGNAYLWADNTAKTHLVLSCCR